MPQQRRAPQSRERKARTRAALPEYASCERCGEFFQDALRRPVASDDHVCLCHNCADVVHKRGTCAVCMRVAPIEEHHIASRRQNPELTIATCLNCHGILSQRQNRAWDPTWRYTSPNEAAACRFEGQGWYDVHILACARMLLGGDRTIESAAGDGATAPHGEGTPSGFGALWPALTVLLLLLLALCLVCGHIFGHTSPPSPDGQKARAAAAQAASPLDPDWEPRDWPELDRWLDG